MAVVMMCCAWGRRSICDEASLREAVDRMAQGEDLREFAQSLAPSPWARLLNGTRRSSVCRGPAPCGVDGLGNNEHDDGLWVFLDHLHFGAEDFLDLLARYVGGRRPALQALPSDILENGACLLEALTDIAGLLAWAAMRPRRPQVSLGLSTRMCLHRCIRQAAFSQSSLLHEILCDVFAALPQLGELSCWLPVAFERREPVRDAAREPARKGERNAVSVAPFRIARAELSEMTVERVLAGTRRVACGIRLLSLVANAANAATGCATKASQFARELVDVVVSIGHVVDVPTPADLNLACTFVPNAARPYAVYVNCLVLHGPRREAVANVTYSFACAATSAPLLAKRAKRVFCNCG